MSDEHKDYVIMACIVHDTCKYGEIYFDKDLYKDHAVNASVMVNNAWYDYFGVNASEFFLSAIKCHMGQWSERENRPFTNIDRCVHMADYMASRNFIDIPQVSEEWEAVRFEEVESKGSEDPINPNTIGGQMVRRMIEMYEKNQ